LKQSADALQRHPNEKGQPPMLMTHLFLCDIKPTVSSYCHFNFSPTGKWTYNCWRWMEW